MGHYWRDMDPAGARESDNRLNKALKLRVDVGKMRLSKFKVKDLPGLLRVMEAEPHEEDFKLLKR